MPSTSVSDCWAAIASKAWNVAFVECATAGRMSSEFSLCDPNGTMLRGGMLCHDAFVRKNVLKLPQWVVDKYPPESAEITESLAIYAAAFFETDVTVAITGIIASGGNETPEKPVGTIFIHIILPMGAIAHQERFFGTPERIILQAIDRTAELITARIGSLAQDAQ